VNGLSLPDPQTGWQNRHLKLRFNRQTKLTITVMIGQDALYSLTGKTARFFRAGIADYDETAVAIVPESGLMPASFSINGDVP
jgi:hypothetical protein